MNWIKWIILSILLVLFTIILLFTADLVAKKYLGLGQPIVYDAHPLWGYAPRANSSYKRFDGDVVTINEVGTRSISGWNSEGKNILFLGDSITYGGSYIDDDQTFASLVCENFVDWSCQNAGVNSYGIINIVTRSRYDERINQAPLRVITFITADFDRGLRSKNTAHFILRSPPRYLSGLWEIGNFLSSYINPKGWFGKQDQRTLNNLVSAQEQNLNRQFALDILKTEIDRLEAESFNYLLVHSPSQEELTNLSLIEENEILNLLKSRYSEHFLSLHEFLLSPYQEGKEQLYRDHVHFEEEGHQVVANAISLKISNSFGENPNFILSPP